MDNYLGPRIDPHMFPDPKPTPPTEVNVLLGEIRDLLRASIGFGLRKKQLAVFYMDCTAGQISTIPTHPARIRLRLVNLGPGLAYVSNTEPVSATQGIPAPVGVEKVYEVSTPLVVYTDNPTRLMCAEEWQG